MVIKMCLVFDRTFKSTIKTLLPIFHILLKVLKSWNFLTETLSMGHGLSAILDQILILLTVVFATPERYSIAIEKLLLCDQIFGWLKILIDVKLLFETFKCNFGLIMTIANLGKIFAWPCLWRNMHIHNNPR